MSLTFFFLIFSLIIQIQSKKLCCLYLPNTSMATMLFIFLHLVPGLHYYTSNRSIYFYPCPLPSIFNADIAKAVFLEHVRSCHYSLQKLRLIARVCTIALKLYMICALSLTFWSHLPGHSLITDPL